MTRYARFLPLFMAVLAADSSRLEPGPEARVAEHGITSARGSEGAPSIPEAVRAAAEEGRYWRATRLMDAHLATLADTAAATILYAARLHAGWDHWYGVRQLLEGRDWLDRLEGGAGLELLGRAWIAGGDAARGADALDRYASLEGVSARERAVAELRRGQALAGIEDRTGALDAFDTAGRLLPWMADWTALMAAEVAAAAGDTAAVRERLGRAGGVGESRSWRLRLEAAREAGDSMAAREIALETAQSASAAGTRSRAWAQLGSLRLAAGDTVRARSAFVEAMSAPATIGAVDGARALSRLRPSPEEWRRIGEIYARHGNARRAAEGYQRYLEGGAGTAAERQEARLALGRALFNAGDYAAAERQLLRLADEGAAAAVGAEALYLAGRAQYRQGRSQDGQRTLARLPERFPGEEAVTRGVYLLADLKHDDGRIAEARRYYRQAADAAPHLNEAGLSLMRLGGLDMLQKHYDDALAVFEEYRRLHPDGRRWGQATYWAARALAALGRPAEAEARLRELRAREPLSYYGVRAAERLGEPLLETVGASAPRDTADAARVEDGLRRVDVLAAIGRRGDLSAEIDRVRGEVRGAEPAEYALAEALNERGHTVSGINLGWELYRRGDGWNPRLLQIVYPFPFRNLVVPEARERGLDPYLVAGLIRQESAFNPTVTSGAGAIGLMQVMPETGRALAREVDLDGYRPDLLRQPEVNVRMGTRYLATMLERFRNDLPLVLSAYNAGPTRAVRWRELPEARDPELFTERIPYRETRDYVRHVQANRALYRALYPDIAAAGGD